MMADDKSPSKVIGPRDRDRELLLPIAISGEDTDASKPSSSSSSVHHAGREVMISL